MKLTESFFANMMEDNMTMRSNDTMTPGKDQDAGHIQEITGEDAFAMFLLLNFILGLLGFMGTIGMVVAIYKGKLSGEKGAAVGYQRGVNISQLSTRRPTLIYGGAGQGGGLGSRSGSRQGSVSSGVRPDPTSNVDPESSGATSKTTTTGHAESPSTSGNSNSRKSSTMSKRKSR
jgi:hypothetical protein